MAAGKNNPTLCKQGWPLTESGRSSIICYQLVIVKTDTFKHAHNRNGASVANNKILIADDNQANVELLEAYLSGLDCEIAIAVDGQDTLDKVASFQPDLVLLDIMMPKLSGFEVCKQIKENPQTAHILVIMVTALNELGDIERAVAAKTNDFLSKPVNQIALLKRVENLLQLKNLRDDNERLRKYIENMEDQGGPAAN